MADKRTDESAEPLPRAVYRGGSDPNATPIWGVASKYGVLDCFSVAEDCDIFRCGHCARLFMAGSAMVVVPDHIWIHDSPDTIRAIAAATMAYQGNATGWCVPCARRLGHEVIAFIQPRETWFTWLFGAMR